MQVSWKGKWRRSKFNPGPSGMGKVIKDAMEPLSYAPIWLVLGIQVEKTSWKLRRVCPSILQLQLHGPELVKGNLSNVIMRVSGMPNEAIALCIFFCLILKWFESLVNGH